MYDIHFCDGTLSTCTRSFAQQHDHPIVASNRKQKLVFTLNAGLRRSDDLYKTSFVAGVCGSMHCRYQCFRQQTYPNTELVVVDEVRW